MTDHQEPGASQTPPPAPGQSSNGTAAFKRPDAVLIGQAAGKAVAELLAPQFGQLAQFLPQMVAQGVAQALQQVPVRTRRLCAKCLTVRIAWEAAHAVAMKQAVAAAAVAAGIMPPGADLDQSDPRLGQLEIGPYLPDHLRPGGPEGMPQIMDAITTAAGDEVCPMHLPGVPQQPGRRPLLIAPAGMTPAMAARLASQAA